MEHTLKLRKGAWTSQEDDRLRTCIGIYGEGQWHRIPLRAGLNRCRKSCRLRWLNYLKPNIKRGEFAADEVDLIIRLHKLLGNRWSLIAGRIPGRTANDIKNYWNTHLKKKHLSPSEKEANTRKKTRHLIFKPQPRNLSNKFFSGFDCQNSSQDIARIPECDNISERMSLWWGNLVPNSVEEQGMKRLSNVGENVEDKSLSTGLFLDDFNIWDLLDSPLHQC